MSTRLKSPRTWLLFLLILGLLSCRLADQISQGFAPAPTAVPHTATSPPASPTELPTLTFTPTDTHLPATPTEVRQPTFTPTLFLSPTPTGTATGTPFGWQPSATLTLTPSATQFIPPTSTPRGPLIINLNGKWEGLRIFDAKCGSCEFRTANSLLWRIDHIQRAIFVNNGLEGTISGTVVTLEGTETLWDGGWLKVYYILKLQPDGKSLEGYFWGQGRLRSRCVEQGGKILSCNVQNGSITLER